MQQSSKQFECKDDYYQDKEDIAMQIEIKDNHSEIRDGGSIQENVRKLGMQVSPEKKDISLKLEKNKEQSLHSSTDDILKVNLISNLMQLII